VLLRGVGKLVVLHKQTGLRICYRNLTLYAYMRIALAHYAGKRVQKMHVGAEMKLEVASTLCLSNEEDLLALFFSP
jgi:hypothetical protein